MINNAGTPETALVYVRQDDLSALQSEVRLLQGFVDFVNLWCTRDRRGMTHEEVLSVIKNHPIPSDRRRLLSAGQKRGAQ